MKLSQSFIKTFREVGKEETARNAQLLIRAGYIHKEMAGVYDFLPLGLITLNKIQDIIFIIIFWHRLLGNGKNFTFIAIW